MNTAFTLIFILVFKHTQLWFTSNSFSVFNHIKGFSTTFFFSCAEGNDRFADRCLRTIKCAKLSQEQQLWPEHPHSIQMYISVYVRFSAPARGLCLSVQGSITFASTLSSTSSFLQFHHSLKILLYHRATGKLHSQ